MRKLTVKNFSVIKDAELEFGKITVLIGPQSSGKSLLCKLAYFLGREVVNIAIDRVVNRFDLTAFDAAVREEFTKWFPEGGWGNANWSIEFKSDAYWLRISAPSKVGANSELVVELASALRDSYSERLEQAKVDEATRGFAPPIEGLRSLAASKFTALAGRGVWDSSTYIPVDRSYFVDTTKGYKALGAEADPIMAQFAQIFANSLGPSPNKRRVTDYLGANLVSWPGGWMLDYRDGRFLPLSQASSGGKELLPILSVLDYYEQQRRQSGRLVSAELYGKTLYVFDDFTIEEPESSVFPQIQYDLVKDIGALANEIDFQPHFTVTTHSPYIMTAFNTLIEAGRVGGIPGNRERVSTVIPEQYWIKEGDFKAYAIQEGKLISIFKPEAEDPEGEGMINGDYLDSVSDQLGKEFDRLLDIEFAE